MEDLKIVCVAVGDRYGDQYVARLQSMLLRHLHEPFSLICWTDRTRALPDSVQQVDTSGWGLQGWFTKLRAFDPEVAPPQPFLMLDVSLVIKESLLPLIQFARQSPASVVAVDDWHRPGINSCCMFIRPTSFSAQVWQDYASGVKYETSYAGDQDYIQAVFSAHHFEDGLTSFPPGMVESYKRNRRLRRADPAAARQALDNALILKFHGEPKMHTLADPQSALIYAARKPMRMLREWNYLAQEVRDWWQ